MGLGLKDIWTVGYTGIYKRQGCMKDMFLFYSACSFLLGGSHLLYLKPCKVGLGLGFVEIPTSGSGRYGNYYLGFRVES